MVYYIRILGCCCILCLWTACAGTSKKVNYSNPKNVSLAFYRALAANDLEQAKQVGTNQTKNVLVLLQTLSDGLPQEEWERRSVEMKEQVKKLKKAKCTIAGEQATCSVCCDETGGFSSTITLKLVDKKWLVDMKKEDLKD